MLFSSVAQFWLPVTGGGRSAAGYLCSVLCSVRGPEYPERYLNEITWASKPDSGISTTQKASPNLRHRQAHARNKGLNRDSRLQTFPLR